MKTTVEFFDVVLLLVLLGLMLPFLFGMTKPLADAASWGFAPADDKTMKRYGGDLPIAADDALTAAEAVLISVVHDRPTIYPSRYELPSGTLITVDDDYPTRMVTATRAVQAAVDPTQHYRMVYDYEHDRWILRQEGGD